MISECETQPATPKTKVKLTFRGEKSKPQKRKATKRGGAAHKKKRWKPAGSAGGGSGAAKLFLCPYCDFTGE